MKAFERMLREPRPLETVREINQQPAAWGETCARVVAMADEIRSFLHRETGADAACRTVILTGAGSSEFVGRSIEGALRRKMAAEVITVPTTHFLTHCESVFLPARDYLLVSFARSGDSPESVATFQQVAERFPRVKQAVITCNKDGSLARLAAKSRDSLCILLPEQTNDKSLAMTSSFSSLALAGLSLGFADAPALFAPLVEKAAAGALRVIAEYGDLLSDFARLPFTRACYLGSNTLLGCMQEARLKMQEMTAGRVASAFDSFLGLRHGPQVFVNGECVVVASLSSDPSVRRYERDLLRELRGKKQGIGTLVICDRADQEMRGLSSAVIELYPSAEPLEDDYRVLTDIVACQILAVFKSIQLGLSPDNPSPDGIINRVVAGITVYPWA
jgi:tagatose-6-phosphate ketose/aldose isomerase